MRAIVKAGAAIAGLAQKQLPASMGLDRGWMPLGGYGASGSPRRVAAAIDTYGGTDESSVTVFSCTTLIADTLAGYEWAVTDMQGEELDPTPADQDLFDLLEEPGADEMTYFDFAADAETDVCLVGNSYWLKEQQNPFGQPLNLERMTPGDIKVATDQRDRKIGYVVTVKGVQIAFSTDDIIHYRTRNPLNKHYGMGIVEALLRQLELDISVTSHITSFFTNGARIAGVLTVADTMDDKQFERLKRQVDEDYGGAHNAYRTLIAEGATDYKPITQPPAALGVVDLSNLSEDKVLQGFGTPKFMLGGREEGGVPKMEQSQFIFYRRMVPRARRFQEKTTLSLVSRWEGRKFIVKPEMSETPSTAVEIARNLPEAGASLNEARARAGLPEIDDAKFDEPLLPAKTLPWSVAVNLDRARPSVPGWPGTGPPQGSGQPGGPQDQAPQEGQQQQTFETPQRPRYRRNKRMGTNGMPLPPGRRVAGVPAHVRALMGQQVPLALLGAGDDDGQVMVEAPQLPPGYEQRAPLIDPGEATAGAAQRMLEGQAAFFVLATPRFSSVMVDFFNQQRGRVLGRLNDHRSKGKRAANAAPNKKELKNGDDIWDVAVERDALLTAYLALVDELGGEAIRVPASVANTVVQWDEQSPYIWAAREKLAEQVVRINETTRQAIADIVEEGLRRGLPIGKIANGDAEQQYKGIQGVFDEATAARAETIARTETAFMYNAAATASFKAASVDHVQVFDGTGDPGCADAAGSVWTVDEADANPIEHPNCVRAFAPITPQEAADFGDDTGAD